MVTAFAHAVHMFRDEALMIRRGDLVGFNPQASAVSVNPERLSKRSADTEAIVKGITSSRE